jgi:hypothetical protein
MVFYTIAGSVPRGLAADQSRNHSDIGMTSRPSSRRRIRSNSEG